MVGGVRATTNDRRLTWIPAQSPIFILSLTVLQWPVRASHARSLPERTSFRSSSDSESLSTAQRDASFFFSFTDASDPDDDASESESEPLLLLLLSLSLSLPAQKRDMVERGAVRRPGRE